MKTYEEMIQYLVDQVDNGKFRYHEWAPILTLAEAYSVDEGIVFADVALEKSKRSLEKSKARKKANQEANEQRRLANLDKKIEMVK